SYQILLAQLLKTDEKKVILEAPFKHKRVDIVTFQGNKIISIEVKISNFSRLLYQAAQNLVFSDFSFIAIPEKNYNKRIFKRAKELALGIIVLSDNDFEIVLKPKNNPYKILSFYESFKKSIMRCN
ncbi:MAG: hypothetical protein ACFFDF_17865, partial [Candidatus Odinarchaeota archaeon]